ncbi:DUF397 domain-containing protein [Amycolatopsis balhimycina DSM 5908]|uniref:DUF397 domain-containing protein n=1 Tax=Amycolatopsis balhimycina DSM 5908 TaxID=1081091 RepID=A0A428W0W7_AMYBA|nr:DUF397 domain-containing protein [Amycolatopsis balhimycina]RSM36722.1 DUF397 domain-containing protein [Amycolatopsis balhimycina DSM 5908]
MFTWRKSSYTAKEECVEVGYDWHKSSYSGAAECVEVALSETVGVRDTKARHLGQLTVSPAAWTALCTAASVVQPAREHRG